MRRKILQWSMIGAGLLIILAGLLTFWLPIPIGLPLMLSGTAILMRFSSGARRILVNLMRRYPLIRELRRRARGRSTVRTAGA